MCKWFVPHGQTLETRIDGFRFPSLGRHSKISLLMNYYTDSNVITGSKLALAMSGVIRPSIRIPAATASERKRVELAKMHKRCEALKNRSLKLLDEMEVEDTRIAFGGASMSITTDREAIKSIAKDFVRIKEKQTTLHFKMEKLLDAMMLKIRSENGSNA